MDYMYDYYPNSQSIVILLPKSDGDIIQREILDPGPALPFFPIVNYLFLFSFFSVKIETAKPIR